MAKKIILSFSIILGCIALVYLISPRQPIVSLLAEKSADESTEIDIYFVFSGGFINNNPGRSTRERISILKKLLQKHPKSAFVFLDYSRGKRIINKLFKNEQNKNFLSHYRYTEKHGGTENNVLELISILKKHKEYKRIGIITSVYHEKRVKFMLNYYLKMEKLKGIKIFFFHDNNQQEVYSCSYPRYLKLTLHEFLGIVYFLIIEGIN